MRSFYPYGAYFPLMLGPIVGLFWSRGHVLPLLMVCALTLALISVGFAGSLLQSFIDGPTAPGALRSPAGMFQLLWLGQYAIVGLVIVSTPLTALMTGISGWKLPLRASLPLTLLAVGYLRRRRLRSLGVGLVAPSPSSFLLGGLVLLAVYRAMHLHGRHAGALGHDTLQHIYWAQHIFDFGFLPITSRGTDLIELYPKFFHVLAASWSAAGLAPTVGPLLKIMPFMQGALGCGFACELLYSELRARQPKAGHSLMPLLAGLFLCWHLTSGDRQLIYPHADLSGTARYAAGWLLFGLPLLVLAHRVGSFRDLRSWLVGSVPVLASLAVGTNPVIFVLLFSFSVPFAGLLYALTRPRERPSSLAWRAPLLRGVFLAIYCQLLNPAALGALGRYRPAGEILNWLGVRLVPRGIEAESWTWTPTPLCSPEAASCFADVARSTFGEGWDAVVHSLRDGQVAVFGPGKHGLAYWLVFCAPIGCVLLQAVRSRARPAISRDSVRLSSALVLATLLPSLLHPLLAAGLRKLSAFGPLWWLLSEYFSTLAVYFGAWMRGMLPFVFWIVPRCSALSPRRTALAWVAAAAVSVAFLSQLTVPQLSGHRHAGRWRIDWPELRAIMHLNAFIPSTDAVLIPAAHLHLGNHEHILASDNYTGMVVPHLSARTLFGVSLGTGVDYGWADLEQFCASPSARRALLRRNSVRWLLLRDRKPTSTATLERKLWSCGTKLKELSPELPPAWNEGDLWLFRIHP